MHGLHQVRARGSPDSIIPKASILTEGVLFRAWAFALALIVLSLPLYSPDLFWHLSAGRWILAHAAVPVADSFSFTRYGQPWIDFEWLAQVIFYVVHSLAGMWGLWALKVVFLLAAFFPVDGLLRDKGASSAARAAGLALWSCAALAQADLRIDLLSACFFAVLLRRLESGQASFLFGFGLFSLWGNLHAGFAVGLALYLAYALAARFGRGKKPANFGAEVCGALLGALVNPYGLKIYSVLLTHGGDQVGSIISEWGPVDWRLRFQRPLIGSLIVGAGLVLSARRRAPALVLSAAVLGAATVLSARFGIYFAAAAAGCFAASFPRPKASWVIVGLMAATLLLGASTMGSQRGLAFSDVYVARNAVDFVAGQCDVFGPLRLFNTYEWGGYLGWRLGLEGRVYGDGRYLFHGQLPELQQALTGPEPMRAFVERNQFDALLIRAYPDRLPSVRVYPDGTRREMLRPWYLSYLPRDRWALAWWDEKAMVFVDRSKVSVAWLAAHEYRWWRPWDGEALSDALSRGEIPVAALEAEKARQRGTEQSASH